MIELEQAMLPLFFHTTVISTSVLGGTSRDSSSVYVWLRLSVLVYLFLICVSISLFSPPTPSILISAPIPVLVCFSYSTTQDWVHCCSKFCLLVSVAILGLLI